MTKLDIFLPKLISAGSTGSCDSSMLTKADIVKCAFDQLTGRITNDVDNGTGTSPAGLGRNSDSVNTHHHLYLSAYHLVEFYVHSVKNAFSVASNDDYWAYRNMGINIDGSVKGATHYLLGQAFARALAERYLELAFIQDFDYWRNNHANQFEMCDSGKKPDMIAWNNMCDLPAVLESKGLGKGYLGGPHKTADGVYNSHIINKEMEKVLKKALSQVWGVRSLFNKVNIKRYICASSCVCDALFTSALFESESPDDEGVNALESQLMVFNGRRTDFDDVSGSVLEDRQNAGEAPEVNDVVNNLRNQEHDGLQMLKTAYYDKFDLFTDDEYQHTRGFDFTFDKYRYRYGVREDIRERILRLDDGMLSQDSEEFKEDVRMFLERTKSDPKCSSVSPDGTFLIAQKCE